MTSRLADKTVLITGAAGSLGSSIAEAIRAEGGVPICTGHQREGIDHALDVTSEDNWRSVIAEIERIHGELDGLVNAAGITVLANVEGTDFATWRRIMAVNLDGAFLGCKYAMPLLRKSGGSIVNIASVYAKVGNANLTAYAASKGGLLQLTKSVALSGASWKPPVRCNALCPAFLDGAMMENATETTPYPTLVRQALKREIPLGRFGQTNEVAKLAVYLLSDDAAFVTGSEFTIDGGLTAR